MNNELQAIVLAGGLGTRLRGVLGEVPKVLALIDGEPWLAWVLRGLSYSGVKRVCLATGHGRALVRDCAERVRLDGLRISYSEETSPLGTGGALKRASTMLPAAPTFVLNGDTWISVPWRGMLDDYAGSGCDLAIAVRQVSDRSRYGAVDLIDSWIVGFGEKARQGSGLINAGVYLLRPELLLARDLPACFSFETDFIQPQVATLHMRGFVVDRPFLDIGVPDDLARAEKFVRDHLSAPR